jgi:toxin ParE1/3/4
LTLLADSPNLARERTELSPPARIHPAGSHVVVYTIENDGSILIARVRHGREDWAGSP